jgi:hypothetical protein
MMGVSPVSIGNKDTLEANNVEVFQDEVKAFISENSKVVAVQTDNSKGAAPTLAGASSSFSVIIPGSGSTFSNPMRRRSCS